MISPSLNIEKSIVEKNYRVRPVKPPSLNESQFLKMVSPSKPDSTPESKSKTLIDQVTLTSFIYSIQYGPDSVI